MWEAYKVRSRWRADGGRIDPKAAGPAYALPSTLLDGLSWDDVLAALDHEEGRAIEGGEHVPGRTALRHLSLAANAARA